MSKNEQLNLEGKNLNSSKLLDELSFVDYHTKMDILSFIPFVGNVFNLINAVSYCKEHNYKSASISLLGLIPFVGKYFVLPRVLVALHEQITNENN